MQGTLSVTNPAEIYSTVISVPSFFKTKSILIPAPGSGIESPENEISAVTGPADVKRPIPG